MGEHIPTYQPELEIFFNLSQELHFPYLQQKMPESSRSPSQKAVKTLNNGPDRTFTTSNVETLLKNALQEPAYSLSWKNLLCADLNSVMSASYKLEKSDQTIFVRRFMIARKMYMCECCQSYTLDMINAGFYICERCSKHVHIACLYNKFVCSKCITSS